MVCFLIFHFFIYHQAKLQSPWLFQAFGRIMVMSSPRGSSNQQGETRFSSNSMQYCLNRIHHWCSLETVKSQKVHRWSGKLGFAKFSIWTRGLGFTGASEYQWSLFFFLHLFCVIRACSVQRAWKWRPQEGKTKNMKSHITLWVVSCLPGTFYSVYWFCDSTVTAQLVFPLACFSMSPCPFLQVPCPFSQHHALFLKDHMKSYNLVKIS